MSVSQALLGKPIEPSEGTVFIHSRYYHPNGWDLILRHGSRSFMTYPRHPGHVPHATRPVFSHRLHEVSTIRSVISSSGLTASGHGMVLVAALWFGIESHFFTVCVFYRV